jgi:CDGSH-type Zn-finger protein
VALCRCGGSRNKPFCDGTHSLIGFKDERSANATPNRRESYAGRRITIHDNRGICSHAGFCTDRLKSVFRMRVEPWIDANGAGIEEIIETIKKCPSGALSYSIGKVEHRDQERAPAVTVMNDGPYAITGGIELLGVTLGEGASKEHYTLCRCGGSKNKPFCDGTHWQIGFRDPAPTSPSREARR